MSTPDHLEDEASYTPISPSSSCGSPVPRKTPMLRRLYQPLLPQQKDQINIYLGEQLYGPAIALLNSLLSDPLSSRVQPCDCVPSRQQLAFIGNLVVHPAHTTLARRAGDLKISASAMSYLQNLVATAGPVAAGASSAFRFRSRRLWPRLGNAEKAEGELCDGIHNALAHESSLWAYSSGFWATVGWALNCSALYPGRWRYWRIWLEFMLDVLEADWEERVRMDGDYLTSLSPSVQKSLIVAYLNPQQGRFCSLTWIVNSLFADGSRTSLAHYPSVFSGELRPTNGIKRKWATVVSLEQLCDDEGDEGLSQPSYLWSNSIADPSEDNPPPPSSLPRREDVEVSQIRLRLFRLLESVCVRKEANTELSELYERFVTAVCQLPVAPFALMVTHFDSRLSPGSQATLLRELFARLLPSKVPDPAKIDPTADGCDAFSVAILQHCFLPFVAASLEVADHARVSLLVESAILLLRSSSDGPHDWDALRPAALTGVQARQAASVKKRGQDGDRAAREVLAASAQRIEALVTWLTSSA